MEIVEGRNPVCELLKGSRQVKEIILQKGSQGERIDWIRSAAQSQGIPLKSVDPAQLDKMASSGAHQGVLARAEPLQYYSPGDLLAAAREQGHDPFIVILDQIQDPHNFGAILRTAQAAGASGVIFPERRSAPVTPVVIKAAAGAVEHLRLSRVSNINYALKKLKDSGLWIAGTVVESNRIYYETDLTGPLGIVVGNEGTGLRRLVRENCDFLVKIPMYGKMGSLNVSVATGVVLFEALRQRNTD